MARKRVVEVEVESGGSAIWWMLAGTAAGVAIGVIAAERMSGRPLSGRSLLRKARRLLGFARGRWAPLLDIALAMKDAWEERRAGKARDDEPDDELDAEYDEDDFEVDVEVDLDDEPSEELDEDATDDDADDADDADEDGNDTEAADHPIAARVLEAFINDPILAERAVEIDADDEGKVLLRGRVRTAREVAHAVTIAGGVPGVSGVRQRLLVRERR